MAEREYRQDDTSDGYCPHCGDPLSGLTTGARGYCDRHGWTWANWIPPAVRDDTHSKSDDDERNDDR